MNVAKVEAKPKTIRTTDVNTIATLPRQCHLRDKLSILFKSNRIMWGRSKATSKNENTDHCFCFCVFQDLMHVDPNI